MPSARTIKARNGKYYKSNAESIRSRSGGAGERGSGGAGERGRVGERERRREGGREGQRNREKKL